MKILFYTFPEGHLVSDKEFNRLQKGFAKAGMELIRWHKDKGEYTEPYDIIMVKGFSHTWDDLPNATLSPSVSAARVEKKAPVIYLSIGAEYKKGINLKEANEPIRELYEKADAVVHISEHCKWEHKQVFGKRFYKAGDGKRVFNIGEKEEGEYVIIPAEESKLPEQYKLPQGKLKLATTCIPRPVKRTDELERLCKKYNIELVPAWGGVEDFSYYYECHGYIHLSRKEGMPNTVLEALAYGLPCIVTNYGGAKEAVGDAGIVILNDPQDVMWDPSDIEPIDDYLFSKAIEEFLAYLPMFQLNVRKRVLSQLNDKICAEKFKAVFESCLK